MVVPLIWAGIGIVSFVAQYLIFEYQGEQLVSEIEDVISQLTVEYVYGMGFEEFIGAYWVHIAMGFVVLFVGLWLASPKVKRRWGYRS